jgi:hypothetical protein
MLTDFNPACAEVLQSLHFGSLVIWAKIEVHPVLGRFLVLARH